ncbi:MAG: BlaI/MecI/CopY family transcriptional regulator [Acetatifactor sp.]|nr:BlaI/MecI/CopY family transcriptional regulator [Acetatifactor sp.]
MEILKLHESEYYFCLIMWEHEPVTAAMLVELCQELLGWEKTTTYTVIKRLEERGVLKNENGTITSLVSKAQTCEYEIEGMQGSVRVSEQYDMEFFNSLFPQN